ncbi:hypothetical protein [Paenibacillus durus]|uniref:Serine kinase n=1 Tax=Paenibacillus durus TaxID=44251 RepID=A0A089HXI8_PAEDU|nr:hypothetical protein [Paenibacillus durus]AIQ15083.1 hypothetical protein PDUR_26845 [Paenibacillus durus]
MFSREIAMPFGNLVIQSTNSAYLAERVLGSASYTKTFADRQYHLYLHHELPPETKFYRQEMLERGIYLGHHHGVSGRIQLARDALSITLDCGSQQAYEKIIWSYALKQIITCMSLDHGALHLKASMLLKNEKAILLLGRGKSGKTTLASFLEQSGYYFAGNTHVMVKDYEAWSINSWRRIRDSDARESYILPDHRDKANSKIQAIYIVDCNRKGQFVCSPLDDRTALSFITYFAAAIGNYDLKEDMVDTHRDSSFSERMRLLGTENILIRRLIRNFKVHYISADIFDSDCAVKAYDYINKGMK